MKNLFRMCFVFVAAVTLLSSFAQAGWKFIPSESGDYCRDEAEAYLERRYPGAKVFQMRRLGQGTLWQYYASTSLCADAIVFLYTPMESFNCLQGQYFKRTRYLQYVYGLGHCKYSVRRDRRPNSDIIN